MGLARTLLLWFGGTFFSSVLAWSQAPTPPVPPVPLVLAGGTIIDVTDWGRSAKDQPDSIVIVQNGRITAAGCFLPLTANPNVSKTRGTRHRAAIGLTIDASRDGAGTRRSRRRAARR